MSRCGLSEKSVAAISCKRCNAVWRSPHMRWDSTVSSRVARKTRTSFGARANSSAARARATPNTDTSLSPTPDQEHPSGLGIALSSRIGTRFVQFTVCIPDARIDRDRSTITTSSGTSGTFAGSCRTVAPLSQTGSAKTNNAAATTMIWSNIDTKRFRRLPRMDRIFRPSASSMRRR